MNSQYLETKLQVISRSWFSCRSSILVELEYGDVGFCGGWNTVQPGVKPTEQRENQQQIQPTHGTRPESSPGHICGFGTEASAIAHHWAITVPQKHQAIKKLTTRCGRTS